jgi:hypothetical protein
MTAEAFAALVDARRTGPGKWQARCPAHEDRSPSLSIGSGSDGRILLHCFAGCSHLAIVAALGIAVRDLFAGPPPSREQVLKARQERARVNAEARAMRIERGKLLDTYRRLSQVVDSLGEKLARTADDAKAGAALEVLFHESLNRLRSVESQLGGGLQ